MNADKLLRVVEKTEPLFMVKINGCNRLLDVQLMLNCVMMPFVGSGTIQLAESVSGDPSTILRVNSLGADGTRKKYKNNYSDYLPYSVF